MRLCERGTGQSFQMKKSQLLRGIREQKVYWGTWIIRIGNRGTNNFTAGEQGKGYLLRFEGPYFEYDGPLV